MKWKFCLVFFLLFLVLSPLSAESGTELIIPELELEATYEIQGQDLMTLYQTIKGLTETKSKYKSLTDEMMITLKDATTLAQDYEKKNQKLVLQNNFLIGGITLSVGIIVTGVIVWGITSIN